jgi:hypothetical protein
VQAAAERLVPECAAFAGSDVASRTDAIIDRVRGLQQAPDLSGLLTSLVWGNPGAG